MAVVETPYVQEREGVLYVGDTRVTVSSLIAAWLTEGYTAEEVQQGFPAVSLAQVYGTIAYYLDHKTAVDQQLAENAARYDALRARVRAADPAFYQSLDERRARVRQLLAHDEYRNQELRLP